MASLRWLGTGSFVLRLPEVTVLLDCPLDLSCLAAFLPQYLTHAFEGEVVSVADGQIAGTSAGSVVVLNGRSFLPGSQRFRAPRLDMVDVASIDLVLISSHLSMLGLPLLTRNPLFRGRIYATEPVVELGRQMMDELVRFFFSSTTLDQNHGISSDEEVQSKEGSTKGSVVDPVAAVGTRLPPFSVRGGMEDFSYWQELYSDADIKACISRIQRCSYLQEIVTYGNIHIRPTSSGFALGSSNWVLEDGSYKIAYLSASSSALSRHPEPFDFASLANSNLLIATGVNTEPVRNPEQMINEFCTQVLSTLKRRGNVLVPCLPSGIIFDLIEVLANYLATMNMAQVPMYFVSSVADQSVEYANILGEWMCKNRQDKTFLREPPFAHSELIKLGRLSLFPNLHSGFGNALRSPAVVFAGHPSLRCGEIVHLVRLWGSSSKNAIIFPDSDFTPDVLVPFHPLTMRSYHTPIDPRLTFSELNALIDRLKPGQLCVHRSLLSTDPSSADRNSHLLPLESRVSDSTLSFSTPGENVLIHVGESASHMDSALLSDKLAREIQPVIVGTKRVHRVAAVLSTNNHHFVLSPPTKKQSKAMLARRRRLLFGTIALEPLLEHLMNSDVGNIEVQTEPDHSAVVINLVSLNARVRLEGGRTSVEFADRDTRALLRKILLEQLVPL